MRTRTTGSSPADRPGRPTRSPGALGACPNPTSRSSPTPTGSTWSSSGAAPPTGRPGSRGAGLGRSGSTTPAGSSRRPRRSRRSSTCGSRSCMPTPNGRRSVTRRFDLAFSEYGAAIWCDPYRWIPEAARMLRPGGWLIFLGGPPAALALLSDGRRLRARRLPTASRLLRDAPDRVARREREDRRGRVPAAARRDDPAAALERLRDRGPHRDPAARGRHDDPRGHRAPRVGKRYPAEQIWKARKRRND